MEKQVATIFGEFHVQFDHFVPFTLPLRLFPQPSTPFLATDTLLDALNPAATRWTPTLPLELHDATRSQQLLHVEQQQQLRDELGLHVEELIKKGKLPWLSMSLTETEASSTYQRFTPAALHAELLHLISNHIADFGTDSPLPLLSGHFVQLLAWQRIQQINGTEQQRAEDELTRMLHEFQGAPVISNKNIDEKEKPTCDGVCNKIFSPDAPGIESISADVDNFDDSVELYRSLSQLVRERWTKVVSSSTQTNMMYPGINSTLPFAIIASPNGLPSPTKQPNIEGNVVPVLHARIYNLNDATTVLNVVPMSEGWWSFGCKVDTNSKEAVGNVVASMYQGCTDPAVDLTPFTKYPKSISCPVHFILFVGGRGEGGAEEKRDSVDEHATFMGDDAMVKLINYSALGVRVVGKEFLLGRVSRALIAGDRIRVGKDLLIILDFVG